MIAKLDSPPNCLEARAQHLLSELRWPAERTVIWEILIENHMNAMRNAGKKHIVKLESLKQQLKQRVFHLL